jgi:hypothetical protein
MELPTVVVTAQDDTALAGCSAHLHVVHTVCSKLVELGLFSMQCIHLSQRAGGAAEPAGTLTVVPLPAHRDTIHAAR